MINNKIFKAAGLIITVVGILVAQELSFNIAYTGSGQGRVGPCG